MTLELNDTVIDQTGLSAEEVLLELAVHLFKTGKITVGQ
jgi:predicted HTH domain antitoxin